MGTFLDVESIDGRAKCSMAFSLGIIRRYSYHQPPRLRRLDCLFSSAIHFLTPLQQSVTYLGLDQPVGDTDLVARTGLLVLLHTTFCRAITQSHYLPESFQSLGDNRPFPLGLACLFSSTPYFLVLLHQPTMLCGSIEYLWEIDPVTWTGLLILLYTILSYATILVYDRTRSH